MNYFEGLFRASKPSVASSTPRGTAFGTGNNRFNLSTKMEHFKLQAASVHRTYFRSVMDSSSLHLYCSFHSFRPIIPVEKLSRILGISEFGTAAHLWVSRRTRSGCNFNGSMQLD